MSKKMMASILLACALVLASGCSTTIYRNHKADDDVSKTVYKAIGEDVYYLSRIEKGDIIYYDYVTNKEEKEVIYDFVSALNQAIMQVNHKVCVRLSVTIPGGHENVVILTNYSDETLQQADYSGLNNLTAMYPDIGTDRILFMDPSIYTEFDDIRVFSIDRQLQDIAEEQGIDWYKVWPDLEKFEIRER